MSSLYSYLGTSTQVCQRCGRPLLPNQMQCGHCGYYNQMPSSSNTAWETPASAPAQAQTAYGQNQFSQTQWEQVRQSEQSSAQQDAFSVPQQPFFGAQSQSANSSYLDNSYPAQQQTSGQYSGLPGRTGSLWQFGQPVQSGPLYGQGNVYSGSDTTGQAPPSYPNNVYGMPGSSSNYYSAPTPAQQQGFYVPVPQFPQAMPTGFRTGGGNRNKPSARKRKSKSKIGLIIGVIVLLIVLIGGGFGAYSYLKQQNTAGTTAGSIPTATPTPSVAPLFFDTFQKNNNNWDLTSDPGKFSVKIGGGTLTLEDDENRLLPELLPNSTNYSNFRLSVDAVLSKGTQENGYGVYIRAASNQNSELATDYRFEIYGDGTYDIFKGSTDANGNSTSSPLIKYNSSSAIQKAGTVNHLTIIANGSDMSFIVNGQTIATVTDSSYTSGTIALFVSNVSNTTPGAAATFSNLYIYPPQA